MHPARVVSVAVLSALAGALAGFGSMALVARDAQAEQLHLADSGPPEVLANIPASGSQTHTVAASTEGVGGSFVTEVYHKVSPAVVHITNRATRMSWTFFGPQEYEAEATGSGVIVDERGYILTNNHVIQDATQIIVVLNDGQEYEAEIIGADPGTDLALLKVEPAGSLPTAVLGESSAVEVGEWVVAIGNPRGLDWTVTVGVVSALNREATSVTGQTMRGLIQTDASINPGNSGGPLLNARGEVIGINEIIVSSSGGSEGIGLAIPINTAKEVLPDLKQYGRVIRPWLGIVIYRQVTPVIARRLNLPVDYGVIVDEVFRDSPAFNAGIVGDWHDRRGNFSYDIIAAIDAEQLDEDRELLDLVRNLQPGDSVEATVYRIENGQYNVEQMQVVLQALPEEAPQMGII